MPPRLPFGAPHRRSRRGFITSVVTVSLLGPRSSVDGIVRAPRPGGCGWGNLREKEENRWTKYQ